MRHFSSLGTQRGGESAPDHPLARRGEGLVQDFARLRIETIRLTPGEKCRENRGAAFRRPAAGALTTFAGLEIRPCPHSARPSARSAARISWLAPSPWKW